MRSGTPLPSRYWLRTVWPGPFGAIMTTSTSFGGLMQPKWMLKPCAKARIMPGRRYGAISFSYIAACFSSLMRIMIMSATLAASAVVMTVRPAASAFAQLLLPS